jgi:hypothetical protein
MAAEVQVLFYCAMPDQLVVYMSQNVTQYFNRISGAPVCNTKH